VAEANDALAVSRSLRVLALRTFPYQHITTYKKGNPAWLESQAGFLLDCSAHKTQKWPISFIRFHLDPWRFPSAEVQSN
jgi:hypothetical protein